MDLLNVLNNSWDIAAIYDKNVTLYSMFHTTLTLHCHYSILLVIRILVPWTVKFETCILNFFGIKCSCIDLLNNFNSTDYIFAEVQRKLSLLIRSKQLEYLLCSLELAKSISVIYAGNLIVIMKIKFRDLVEVKKYSIY